MKARLALVSAPLLLARAGNSTGRQTSGGAGGSETVVGGSAVTSRRSPPGTRILFGSDWMNGSTVDAYVVELPSYAPY